MNKQERRTVDDHLPKWLHSKFLSAVHYIWEVKTQDKELTIQRVDEVWASGQFTDEEMCWVLTLLALPQVNKMVMTSEDYKDFAKARQKKESVH